MFANRTKQRYWSEDLELIEVQPSAPMGSAKHFDGDGEEEEEVINETISAARESRQDWFQSAAEARSTQAATTLPATTLPAQQQFLRSQPSNAIAANLGNASLPRITVSVSPHTLAESSLSFVPAMNATNELLHKSELKKS